MKRKAFSPSIKFLRFGHFLRLVMIGNLISLQFLSLILMNEIKD